MDTLIKWFPAYNCSLYIIRLSIHVYGKHSEMDTYCWPVPKVSILEAVYCSCGLVAVLALSGCTLKVGISSITRSASESSQKALILSYQPDSASTKSIHQLTVYLTVYSILNFTYLNKSVSYSRQFFSAPSSHGSFWRKRQAVSIANPNTIGDGMNANIRTMSCCIPKAKDPWLSGTHLRMSWDNYHGKCLPNFSLNR